MTRRACRPQPRPPSAPTRARIPPRRKSSSSLTRSFKRKTRCTYAQPPSTTPNSTFVVRRKHGSLARSNEGKQTNSYYFPLFIAGSRNSKRNTTIRLTDWKASSTEASLRIGIYRYVCLKRPNTRFSCIRSETRLELTLVFLAVYTYTLTAKKRTQTL